MINHYKHHTVVYYVKTMFLWKDIHCDEADVMFF